MFLIDDAISRRLATEGGALPRLSEWAQKVKYLDGSYDNANINTLQAALNLACEELGVSQDHKKCEAVALLILGYARTGQTDVEELKSYAIERFECSPESSHEYV